MKNKHIFLIDDDCDDLEIFESILCQIGRFDIHEATHGKDAFNKLNQTDSFFSDIIFLDINMPGMKGFSF